MRLIDADALLEQMKKLYQKRSEESNMTGDRAVCVTWNDAVFCINDSPTIDAVPVVRCRECAAYRSMEKSGGLCKNTGFWVPENGFCHDGERKDGAESE